MFIFVDSPEEKVKILEKQVMELIEESCYAAERNDMQMVYKFIFNVLTYGTKDLLSAGIQEL